MSNALTPDIRFKGFADDWEQRKLSDITSLITKGTTPLDKTGIGEVNFVKIENIDETSGEITVAQKISHLEHEGYLRRSQLKENDILFSIAGTLGRVTCVKSNILPANTNQALAIIRLKSEDLLFVLTLLKGKTVADYIKRNPTIGAQPNLSLEQVGKLYLQLPSCDEQCYIGRFFAYMDNLITLHQKELEKLIDIKKSMLINMFPQGDEKVPRIRFKGFSGDWNYPVLGTLGKTYTGLSGKTKEDFGNGYATYITYMNVFTNPITNPSQVDSIESDAMQNEVQEGDIFFTTSSETPEEVGMSSVLLAKSGTTYLNSFCFGYRLNENVKIDKYYLAYLLRSPVVREKIVFLAQGISRFNISKTKMMEIAIPVPEKTEEQEKIGASFFNLDKLIKAQEKKIAQLKNIKSALLNKMFPKGDE